MEHINIDSRINWVDFYSQYVKNPRSCGKDKMHACCPFHQERHPSFWFNTKNGCFKCEGCGESGNATVFLSKIKGIDNAEAYKELLELAGIDTSTEQKKQSSKPPSLPDYGVEQYATEKHFMAEWLKDECGVTAGTDQSGKHIKIPYKDQDGKVQATRKRYNPTNPNGKFKWQKGSTLCLYGLWKIKEFTEYAILVEGESDSQSLWMLGLPTLGVPGATNFQAKWAEQLASIPRLYLHIEPDKGGQTFRQQMISKLYEGGYEGEVLTFTLEDYEVKDPSELYGKNGMDALEQVKTAMSKAETVDLKTEAENLPDLVAGMPVKLREPEGWKLSDDGIFKYDSRTEQYKRVCRTPIIIVKRLRNIETDEEKIQIAFKIRNNWRYGIFNSTTIYQSRNIVSLADLGALITSENAKQVVSFLEALESENIDRIKEAKSVSQLGWATEKNFLPGHGGDMQLDVDATAQTYIKVLETHRGTIEGWCTMLSEHRKRNKFRFLLASAFVPLLLGVVFKNRNVVVYLWANSATGKTAALKAALSAFGNPDNLMLSFNSSQVGFEKTMSLFNNIPVGIDERQLAGTRQEFVEKLVYMAGEGKGKQRGTKSGGIQRAQSWQTWVLATGEEPIVQTCTKEGVSSRVIEIYGKQFESEKDAKDMHIKTADCHGVAWGIFVERLIDADINQIKDVYQKIVDALWELDTGHSYTHCDTISLAATADYLLSVWIFNEERTEAYKNAYNMAFEILNMQPTTKEREVNGFASDYVVEWIQSNEKHFTTDYIEPRYGFMRCGKCYIFPMQLQNALTSAGFSYKKTLKYLYENELISSEKAIVKSIESKSVKVIEFDYNKAINRNNEVPDGFVPIDEDDDLPF